MESLLPNRTYTIRVLTIHWCLTVSSQSSQRRTASIPCVYIRKHIFFFGDHLSAGIVLTRTNAVHLTGARTYAPTVSLFTTHTYSINAAYRKSPSPWNLYIHWMRQRYVLAGRWFTQSHLHRKNTNAYTNACRKSLSSLVCVQVT